jgi:hypothetical protein
VFFLNPIAPDVERLTIQAARLRALAERQVEGAGEIEAALEAGEEPYARRVAVQGYKVLFYAVHQLDIANLFVAVLQSYEMPAAKRKALEAVARRASQRRSRITRGKEIDTYLKALYEYARAAQAIEEVLAIGKIRRGGPKSGSFTLVNMGGFSDAVMSDVVARVSEASALLAAKGLERVLYGDIHVTNTIHRSARVLAFYRLEDDSLFVRANVKRDDHEQAVDTIVHELAHRLHYKFLREERKKPGEVFEALVWQPHSEADREIFDVYRRIKTQDVNEKYGTTLPKVGSTISDGKAEYTVTGIRGRRILIRFMHQGHMVDGFISLKNYLAVAGKSAFVSRYASTKPEENFAEMVVAYCRNRLPKDQVAMLKGILG